MGRRWSTWIEFADQKSSFSMRRVEPSGRTSPMTAVTAISGARASGYPRIAVDRDEVVLCLDRERGRSISSEDGCGETRDARRVRALVHRRRPGSTSPAFLLLRSPIEVTSVALEQSQYSGLMIPRAAVGCKPWIARYTMYRSTAPSAPEKFLAELAFYLVERSASSDEGCRTHGIAPLARSRGAGDGEARRPGPPANSDLTAQVVGGLCGRDRGMRSTDGRPTPGSSGGTDVPPPPISLQERGRFRVSAEDVSELGERRQVPPNERVIARSRAPSMS